MTLPKIKYPHISSVLSVAASTSIQVLDPRKYICPPTPNPSLTFPAQNSFYPPARPETCQQPVGQRMCVLPPGPSSSPALNPSLFTSLRHEPNFAIGVERASRQSCDVVGPTNEIHPMTCLPPNSRSLNDKSIKLPNHDTQSLDHLAVQTAIGSGGAQGHCRGPTGVLAYHLAVPGHVALGRLARIAWPRRESDRRILQIAEGAAVPLLAGSNRDYLCNVGVSPCQNLESNPNEGPQRAGPCRASSGDDEMDDDNRRTRRARTGVGRAFSAPASGCQPVLGG